MELISRVPAHPCTRFLFLRLKRVHQCACSVTLRLFEIPTSRNVTYEGDRRFINRTFLTFKKGMLVVTPVAACKPHKHWSCNMLKGVCSLHRKK